MANVGPHREGDHLDVKLLRGGGPPDAAGVFLTGVFGDRLALCGRTPWASGCQ